ncbi:putative lrr receptor-like serine/threonine-protein kinase [Quercus suber]|uniref:non-specific serine/threonine protein kinase n=1 Tax=Quercus suber TaxID=58331 RepID=A0AAW0JZS2_QUESU
MMMNMKVKPRPCSIFAYSYCLLFFFVLSFDISRVQTATTDPSEVKALNSVFQQWDTQAAALWNISGEPCSGAAINGTDFEDAMNNPAITCDCSYNGGTICHITQLRVYAMDKHGVIPKEIVALKYLTFLKIDQNYFTGPLPAFVGNLSALQTLSIAHNSFSGTIPKELGNLKQLKLLSFGINNFSGTLPPELGDLVKLEGLFINSCGLGGEIPSTFANLQNLRVVGASDSPFTGRIPDFIGNWTKLTSLRFEGNSFEGPIPSTFSNLILLTSLRISDIYNVSSSLDFIKNLTSLTDLVLRNALITGSIPSDIGEYKSLQLLDLSFNNLTGEIPSVLFSMSSLNVLDKTVTIVMSLANSRAPVGCKLQTKAASFTATNANFSIKCGGREMPAEGIVYEAENASSFGPAWYYVTDTEKWAVSNVGRFAERNNQSYVEITLAQVIATSTPELYQTSRMSPGSLRYYGLGLDNGIYNVSLFFAETGFDYISSQTWKSLGRRVFDIYIQGHLELKDFDITKEAGEVEKAIPKIFKANVSENYLEIHLFWAGKGTCCIPVQGYYGPLISAIHVVSDFVSNVPGIPPSNREKKSRLGLIVGIAVPVGVGTLVDGRIVAVKQLSVASHQGRGQFITEISTISAVQHRNLVKLYGCCIEGDRHLLAWTLHENSESLRLVDPTLLEFDESEAARVIAVSLLCTQASPNMRPPMSRVVAMLAGDIEVGIVTSKPSYLTDWNFKDITSNFVSEEDRKHHGDNTNLSQLADPLPSPINVTEPMLGGIIGDGRLIVS